MDDPHADQEIHASIDERPEEPDGYLVLADWLQTQGDPHGEQIVLEHAAQARPQDAAVKSAVHQRRYKVLDPLTEFAEFVQSARMRMGFLQEVEVSLPQETGEMGIRAFNFLRELFTSRAGRFLQTLTVAPHRTAPYVDGALEAFHGLCLPSLRTVRFDASWLYWAPWLRAHRLIRAAPNLRSLTACAVVVELGPLGRSRLERLQISSLAHRGLLRALGEGAPKLVELELVSTRAPSLSKLFRAPFPALRKLRLEVRANGRALDLLTELAESPLSDQLEVLEIGPLGPQELEPAIALLDRFFVLRRVSLISHARLGPLAPQRKRLGNVKLTYSPIRIDALVRAIPEELDLGLGGTVNGIVGVDSETGAPVFADPLAQDEDSAVEGEGWGDPTEVD